MVSLTCLLVWLPLAFSFQTASELRTVSLRAVSSSTRLLSATWAHPDTLEAKREQKSETVGRTAVLVCPAQFCVPADYDCLAESLKAKPATQITRNNLA